MRRIAVIGASLAGLSAARALRAQGFAGRLTVIGDEVRRPYDRPPLSKEFLCGELTEADLALESDDDDLQADWILGAAAAKLDTSSGAVELANGTRVEADADLRHVTRVADSHLAAEQRAHRDLECDPVTGGSTRHR